MHIGSGPGVSGASGMQVQPFLPWRTVVILPSAPTVTIDASWAIDAGAADSALATGSFEAAAVSVPVFASDLLAVLPYWLQAGLRSIVPARSRICACRIVMSPSVRVSEGRAVYHICLPAHMNSGPSLDLTPPLCHSLEA